VATILIVDDEKNYLWMLEELLKDKGYDVITCGKGSEALVRLAEKPIDLLLTDLKMAEMDGMALLAKTREVSPATSAILMTAYGTVERAVEAMRLGAFDVVLKPFANADLLRAITRALERTGLVRENLRLSRALADQYDIDSMIGQSTAMRAVLDKIRRVTDSKTTVFISGESGSGKELVARAIHFNGPRCGLPFVPVNCGALTDTLAESELFGHERGAFTSAMVRHAGFFEQANEGTLFLDEIGELSLATQTRLLRVLDRQEIRRVGSEKPVTVNVRILAATNRELKDAVKTGKFREDLFYRLTVVRIEIPPLRERQEDILLLAESCLQRLIKEGGVRGKVFSPSVVSLLTRYAWPGNVRELQNFVAHAALMAQSEEIQEKDFPIELVASDDWSASLDRILPDKAQLDETLKSIERHLIARALRHSQGVQARAAEMLGISRSLLQYKLKTLSPTPDS
jgi:two-component system NtrC family response regulator